MTELSNSAARSDEDRASGAPVMLVTGSSRGIGAAIAQAAARAGYRVAVNYARSAKEANDVVDRIRAAGGNATAIQADVSREAEVAKLFRAVDVAYGRLDVLVNNAGTLETPDIAKVDGAAIARTYSVNVFAAYHCAREAVRRMSTAHGGRGGTIVNVSSAASRLGGLGTLYAGSKAALEGFSLALAKEVAGQGIRVNAIRPGLIRTGIHEAGIGVEKMLEMARTAVPMARAGEPEEVAEAVLWLASPQSSYVNGATLDVAGGR